MKDEMIKSGDTERVPEAAGDGRAEGMADNSAAARAAAAKAAVTACGGGIRCTDLARMRDCTIADRHLQDLRAALTGAWE